MNIPPDFAARMVDLYGDDGRAWLKRLPTIVADCARRWALALAAPITPLSYNFVVPARRADGTAVILKVGYPNDELLAEIAALRLYAGQGICRLLAAAEEEGAFLLERLQPGTPLAALADDERATAVAAAVMGRLWRPVADKGQPFPTLAAWTDGLTRLRAHFDGGTGPFPAQLVDTAVALRAELLADAPPSRLLHGDLHHHNILAAGSEWRAIDPKGVIGDPAYEVGAFLYNPLPTFPERAEMAALLARRLDQLAERLGLDRPRLARWGLVQAVLSSWWSYEDHGQIGAGTLRVATQLRPLCGLGGPMYSGGLSGA